MKKTQNSCTRILTHLRKDKETAQAILNDLTKVKDMLRAEQNVQRENDPYEVARGYKIRDAKNQKDIMSR